MSNASLVTRYSSLDDRTYAVARSTAALPALRPFDTPFDRLRGASGRAGSGRTAAWDFPVHLLFVFSLCERKNEQQKEAKVPLCMPTSGHHVSPVDERHRKP